MRTMHNPNVTLNVEELAELEAALSSERRVRHWQRYRAMWLLAHGQSVQAVSQTLGCCLASVYNWAARWREGKLQGLIEGSRPGRSRRFDEQGEAVLNSLLSEDPQQHGFHSTGWTVDMLRAQVEKAGYQVSERTIRRTLHKLGWSWKRPKYVLGRPDPDYEQKKGE
jgi:transposase